MGKTINKIKMSLSTLWIAIISFSSKVMGEHPYWVNSPAQPDYWIPTELLTSPKSESPIIAIKIAQVLFVTIIFIVWTISFIKIRKIDDKNQREKKIRNTIIIIAILVLLLILSFLIPFLLLKR